MDTDTFLDRYPEFDSADKFALVERTLAEVLARLDASVFGERLNEAHGALTAHTLWSSAFGVSLRIDGGSEGEKSKYLVHFESIRKATTTPLTMLVI